MKKLFTLLLLFFSLHTIAAVQQKVTFDFSDPTQLNCNIPITAEDLGGYQESAAIVLNLGYPNERTFTQGPVTISFVNNGSAGPHIRYNGYGSYELGLGLGTDIKFSISGGSTLVSIQFDQPNNLIKKSGEPGRFNTDTNLWEAGESKPTSVTFHNGTDYSYFTKIKVTYNSPAVPLTFSYSQPSDGTSVAAFKSMTLYYNTSVTKVNSNKVLLTGSSFDGAKEMTASASGSAVTLSLGETISAEGSYTVSVPAGKFETSEGATNEAINISFTIVPKRDTFTPTSVDPASGTSLGKLPKEIKLTFPAFVKVGTGTVKFKMNDETQFSGTVSVSNKVATISHTHDVTEASSWTVEIPEKMFHNDLPADDVEYRWSPTMTLSYTVDGSQDVPTEVSPTASLSSSSIEKGGDALELTIGGVKKATLATTAAPVFKYADGDKKGQTVSFDGVILTSKTDTQFDVNTTGLPAGKYTLVMPKGTFTDEVASNEIIVDVELTASFEVLTTDTDTPAMKIARALVQQTSEGGVGYPSTESASYKALLALVNATEIPSDESLLTAMNALYNETDVTLPAVDKWYNIFGVNSNGKRIYLAFNADKSKVILDASSDNAAAFQVASVSEGKVVFKTKEGRFLHVLTTLPSHEGTSDSNLTETESNINKLTLAKFAAASVEGADPKELYGAFSIYGSLGTVNDNEEFAYALLNYDNTTIATYPATPLKFDASKSSAFRLTQTSEPEEYDPTDPTDYVIVSVSMRSVTIAKPGDEGVLIVHGPDKTTIADASKIYYTYNTNDERNNTKVDFTGTILTPTATVNEFSVNTKGLAPGSYHVVMDKGAFAYEVPEGKTAKDTQLSATFNLEDGGATPTVTPTASLAPAEAVVAGDELVLTIGNVKKATLSTEAKPVFKYADGDKAGETVPFTGTILTKKNATQFYVSTTGLAVGKYTLVMPKGTFAYEVEEGKAVVDQELTASFEIKEKTPATDEFNYTYNAYNMFLPLMEQNPASYYRAADFNVLIVYAYKEWGFDAMVANPNKKVSFRTTTIGGTAMTGHFENYPNFGADYPENPEFANVFAVKFVPDVPLSPGDLNNHPGNYTYYCEPGCFGDANYGKWLAGDSSVTPSMCRVNDKLNVGTFVIPGNQEPTTGISTVSGDMKNNVIYDLQGRRVQNMDKKGVYIVNGRKVVNK